MEGSVQKDFKLIIDNDSSETMPHTDKTGAREDLQRWPLFGLSVGSFLQVIAMEQQTCLMEAYHSADHWGHFYFVKGALYDSVCGDLKGEDAAMAMISWDNVRVNIKQVLDTSVIVRQINKSLMSLLMESAKRRDEADHGSRTDDQEKRETPPDPEKNTLEVCMNVLKGDMGDALTSASITKICNGTVMASYNTTNETIELFTDMTRHIKTTLSSSSEETSFGDHYIIDLKGKQTLVVLLFADYQWFIVFNNVKCTLGLFRNVIIPKVVNAFRKKHT